MFFWLAYIAVLLVYVCVAAWAIFSDPPSTGASPVLSDSWEPSYYDSQADQAMMTAALICCMCS